MALVALRSYLQGKGVSVVPIDANIDAMHYVLNPERCRQFAGPALSAVAKGLSDDVRRGLAPGRIINADDEVSPLDEARARGVLGRLEDLRTDEGFTLSREHFASELAVVNDALNLASFRMYPHTLTVWGKNPGVTLWNSREHNPYLAYYRDELLPKLEDLSPDAIGISLSYSSQLFYSLFLIDLLRRSGVRTPIVVGGSYFTYLCKVICSEEETEIPFPETARSIPDARIVGALLGFFGPASGGKMAAVDALTVGVRGEGEGPLLAICERLPRGASALDVPNLVYIDSARGALVFNKTGAPLPGAQLPEMDLTGLGVGTRYLSPIPAAPILSSRGCCWDKCAFCSFAQTLDSRFREPPVDVVAGTMESYSKKFGVELAFFCDESMSPSMLKGLTAALTERGLVLNFGTMCRIEKAFLPLIGPAAERGLKSLGFGLESACERVVSLMNKGYRRDVAEALLDECARYGVDVLYYVMFGFPTETPEEADQTIGFLDRFHDRIYAIEPSVWLLSPGSYIMSHPEEFGVVPNPGHRLGMDPATYTLKDGMDRRGALQCVGRLKAHPRLKHLLLAGGHDEYRAIMSALQSRA